VKPTRDELMLNGAQLHVRALGVPCFIDKYGQQQRVVRRSACSFRAQIVGRSR
jgi:hypothetical protein